MKYFDSRLKKREKLVDEYIRLKYRPYHTARKDSNAHLALYDVTARLLRVFPVVYTRWGKEHVFRGKRRFTYSNIWYIHPILCGELV